MWCLLVFFWKHQVCGSCYQMTWCYQTYDLLIVDDSIISLMEILIIFYSFLFLVLITIVLFLTFCLASIQLGLQSPFFNFFSLSFILHYHKKASMNWIVRLLVCMLLLDFSCVLFQYAALLIFYLLILKLITWFLPSLLHYWQMIFRLPHL